jgi:hypothetical protein
VLKTQAKLSLYKCQQWRRYVAALGGNRLVCQRREFGVFMPIPVLSGI